MQSLPTHLMEVSLTPKSKQDGKRLARALSGLNKQDASFSFWNDGSLGQIILKGMSEPHLESIITRIQQKDKIDIVLGAPEVVYQTTVSNGQPNIWEPVMKVEIETPSEFSAAVTRDTFNRRGHINQKNKNKEVLVIDALIPLANMFGYMNTLRSITQERATYKMKFDHYAPIHFPENDPPKRAAMIMRT